MNKSQETNKNHRNWDIYLLNRPDYVNPSLSPHESHVCEGFINTEAHDSQRVPEKKKFSYQK